MTEAAASEIRDAPAREVIAEAVGPTERTPLLDLVDDVADYVMGADVCKRLIALDGRVAVYFAEADRRRCWLWYNPTTDGFVSRGRADDGRWVRTAACRTYAELWVNDYLQADGALTVALARPRDTPFDWSPEVSER
jgi:hypothetical protein